MCRWALYAGPEIKLSWLLTEPVHSIIHQSYKAELREEPLNGDGFGVAWYAQQNGQALAEPALFRSIQPAWNNTNLIELARVTSSKMILAHVRAASPGLGVQQANCHPFKHGRLSFMHNGNVDGFLDFRRQVLAGLSDESFKKIRGTTDSEHVFALFLDAYALTHDADQAGDRSKHARAGSKCERMASALKSAVAQICALADKAKCSGTTFLNLAVSDGEDAVACRYVHQGAVAHSLFYQTGRRYLCDESGVCHLLEPGAGPGATLVASEPLVENEAWQEVPQNHCLLIPAQGPVSVSSF